MRIPFLLSPLCCLLSVALARADELATWPEALDGQETSTVVEADALRGEGKAHLQAEGNVVMRQQTRRVEADQVDFYSDPERVIARGRVRYQQAGLWLQADELDVYTERQTGKASGIRYRVRGLGREGHGDAASIKFAGPQRYLLQNARFSTCSPEKTDWYLGARHIDLDYGRKLGEVHNATLHFLGLPIGWFPWMDFPLDGRRKTGLLAPRIGTISSGGFDVSQPFYWNIAPQMDMTLTPRFMAQRGTQLGTETRYLQPSFSGALNLEWLHHDEQLGRDRYGVNLAHAQQFSPLLRGGINFQKVSDDTYFADLGDRLSAATQVTLPQEIWLDYTTDHWQLLGRMQRYQTLQDPNLPIAPPYRREPQLLLHGQQPFSPRASLHLSSEWVNFRKDNVAEHMFSAGALPEQLNARRLHIYPAVSWNLNTPWVFMTPRLGWMFTQYDLQRDTGEAGGEANQRVTRNLPVFSMDSAVTFEREFQFRERSYVQTLEPRMYYVYIPYRDQSSIPNFDTNELTFNFAQMFSENRFSGVDKINDANQVTLALTSRYLQGDSGRELMRLSLGQRFYFDEQRVGLNHSATIQDSASRSDVLLSAGGNVSEELRFDATVQYAASDERVQRSSLTINYSPRPAHNLNFGYHFRHDELRQVDASVQWPLVGQWYGMARALYSLRDREMLENVAGLEYNAGCWILRLVRQNYVVAADRSTTATFVQLELNGLHGIGTNPLGVLRDSIFGYRKSNELNDEAGSSAP